MNVDRVIEWGLAALIWVFVLGLIGLLVAGAVLIAQVGGCK